MICIAKSHIRERTSIMPHASNTRSFTPYHQNEMRQWAEELDEQIDQKIEKLQENIAATNVIDKFFSIHEMIDIVHDTILKHDALDKYDKDELFQRMSVDVSKKPINDEVLPITKSTIDECLMKKPPYTTFKLAT